MKEWMKKWLRPALFTLGGVLAGLGYYYLVGCSTGSCAITSSPLTSMLYMGLIGWLLSGALGSCCSGGSARDKQINQIRQPQTKCLRLSFCFYGIPLVLLRCYVLMPERIDLNLTICPDCKIQTRRIVSWGYWWYDEDIQARR